MSQTDDILRNVGDDGKVRLDKVSGGLIPIVEMATIKTCSGQFGLMNKHDYSKIGKPHNSSTHHHYWVNIKINNSNPTYNGLWTHLAGRVNCSTVSHNTVTIF